MLLGKQWWRELGLPTGIIKIQIYIDNNKEWLSKYIQAHLLSMTIRIRSIVLLYIPFLQKAINLCITLKLKSVVLTGVEVAEKISF